MTADLTGPIRVLIVDDEEIVCRYLNDILATAADVEVVGVEHDGAAAVEATLRLQPDVVLLDLRMPGADGLAAIQRLRDLDSTAAIVVLTMFDDDHSVTTALRAGASGFLLKSTAPQDLINLVRVAAQGQVVLSPSAARGIVSQGVRAEADQQVLGNIAQLTVRERDVLVLLGQGRSNAEIGRLLQLTESTVKGYVSRVLTKLRCANRTQAGLLAQYLG